MNKIKGFTLSEVLVTMGIIGIVAATLTVVIVNILPDRNKVLFKKAYGSLEEAISNMINDEDSYPSCFHGIIVTDIATGAYTNVKLGFHLLNATDLATQLANDTSCQAGTDTPGQNKFCTLLSQQLKINGAPNCPIAYPSNGTFTTQNGMTWTVVNPGNAIDKQFPLGNDYSTRIIVDVNGAGNKPDCFGGPADLTYNGQTWYKCANNNQTPDTYDIGVRYDGNLQVNPTDSLALSILSAPGNNAKN